MIIRHAEKPSDDHLIRGVTIGGENDKHALSVRGWQRAGALVRFFAPLDGMRPDTPLSTPRSLFASAATGHSPSLRSQQTIDPLAAALRLYVDHNHEEGDESGLAAAALASEGPVLIAWHHKHILDLVRYITGGSNVCPNIWPDERYDIVWILDRAAPGAPWGFAQLPQLLLPGDSAEPIASVAARPVAVTAKIGR